MTPTIWWTIAGCAVMTFAIKAMGPVAVGGRELPPRAAGVIALMAPVLLAALVVTSTLADSDTWHVGAETVGVLAGGGLLLWRRGAVLRAVLLAAVVTAALRALG